MAASSTDKLRKGARRWSGQIGGSGVADAVVTTVPLASTTNLPTDTAVDITIDRVDGSGNLTPTKEEIITGVVSGSNLISCVRGVEGTAQAHSAGAVVEVRLTSAQWDDMVDAVVAEHGQDGAHTVSTSPIVTGWNPTSETCTYATTTTFTTSATLAAQLHKGAKFRCTNDSATKYFYVSDVTGTTVTIVGEVDLVSGSITNPHYSYADCPQGFNSKEHYLTRLRLGTGQTVNTTAVTRVLFDTVILDDSEMFSSVDHVLFIKVSGWYRANLKVFTTNQPATTSLHFSINGTLQDQGTKLTTTNSYVSETQGLYYIVQGQYFEGKAAMTPTGKVFSAGSSMDLEFIRP